MRLPIFFAMLTDTRSNIACDADGGDHLAQIHRHGLTFRDGEDGALLDLALQIVKAVIHGDHGLGLVDVDVARGRWWNPASIFFSAIPPISMMAERRPCNSSSKEETV